MKTRLLREDDLAALAEIESECFAEPWDEKSLAMLTRAPNFGVVACDDEGRIHAYVGVIGAGDEGEITNVATRVESRRRGYARATLERMESEAGERELARLILEVRVSNEGARALYGRMGFEECGIRKNLYRFPREDGVVMAKRLTK